MLGTLEISLVAYADHAGHKSLAGVLIAGLAVGSMVSGTAAAVIAATVVGSCQAVLRVPAEHAASPALAR